MYKKIRMLATELLLLMAITLFVTGVAIAGESSDVTDVTNMCYIVQEGDTLYQISREHQTTVGKLMQYNGLESTKILIGQKLYLPPQNGKVMLSSRNNHNITNEDIMLLARLIHAEARGESFTGKVAVGAVIINRMNSPYFPHSIREVILERNQYVYQFSPVADGSINLEPDDSSILAAQQALKGDDPTNGALFFYNPEACSDKWIRTLPVITRIGNHVFASSTKV
ncbi:cell wall hydrolase [Peptococcaceae bacterium 1198_IL3148]